MATTEKFNSMLKRYMPYKLLVEEMKKKNYFWNKVDKDEGWVGGTLEVPFEGAEASSLSFGELTSASDIADAEYVMATISSQPELWGTMKFHEKDLDRHGDLEKSYLQILPGKLTQFTNRMAERVSLSLLGDGSICKATGNGAVGGTMAVDHPERLALGEKVVVKDDDTAAATGYVRAINMETKVVTLYDARTGGAVVDLSAFTTAQNAKVYLPNALTAGFTGLKSQLLSYANGGAEELHGVVKTNYPFLQAQQHDGSSITSSNTLEKVYDAYFDTISLGKGNPTEVVMSFNHFKNVAKSLEGSRRFVTTDKKAGYGWRSVSLLGPDGEMSITAVRDMNDSEMFVMDWDALKFHGSDFFQRKRHLDGNEFFLVRNTSGYEYIVDIKFYGDLVVNKPSHCGIIHSIA